MAFSEVYQALQTGVVDGQENTPSNMFTQKMNEVQSNMTLTHHGYIGYAVIVNKKFWEGLPADIRTQLEGAMRDASKYTNAISQQENDEALEGIRKAGKTKILELTDAQRMLWRKALLPVHKQMEGRIGKETIDAVDKEVKALGIK
jgi:C4-dicarboxylate-binding protein DctP